MLAISTEAAPNYYLIGDLVVPYDKTTSAVKINNAGMIAGSSQDSNSRTHAVSWTLANDSSINVNYFGTSNSNATSVNNQGVFTGNSKLWSSSFEATIWDHGHAIKLAPPTDSIYSIAYDINDHNQAVGDFTSGDSIYHAVSWLDGRLTYLPALPNGKSTWATDINNAGTIAGTSYDSNYIAHATVWQHGNIVDLGYGNANDINEAGVIVGESDTYGRTQNSHKAVAWTGTGMQILQTLQADSHNSLALSINNKNQIVGLEAYTNGQIHTHAMLWNSLDATPIDLNTMLNDKVIANGWVLTEATSINDLGQIVATGYNIYTDETHPFLLGPDPSNSAKVDVVGIQTKHVTAEMV